MEEFKYYGIEVAQTFAKFKGRVLPPPQVLDPKGKPTNFESYQKGRIQLSQPVEFKKDQWAILYSKRDFNHADKVYNSLYEARDGYGILVEEPQWVEIPGTDKAGFISAVKSQFNPKVIGMVVVVLERREYKKDIKAALDVLGIPS